MRQLLRWRPWPGHVPGQVTVAGWAACTILGWSVLVIAGCTPWATYPPMEGSVGLSDPDLSPIPELMADAIRHIHARDGQEGEIVFNLPYGTPRSVYQAVIKRLGDGRAMTDPAEVAYHVTEIRVRTFESEVDVIHVRPDDGTPEQMTVSFRQNLLTGFRVERVKAWRYPVHVPPPHYLRPVEQRADVD